MVAITKIFILRVFPQSFLISHPLLSFLLLTEFFLVQQFHCKTLCMKIEDENPYTLEYTI